MNKERIALIRKIVVYTLYICLIPSFQVSFPESISLYGQTADLMLVFTVLVSYMFGFADGAVIGIIIGIFRDCFSPPLIQLNSESAPVTAFGIGILIMFLASVCGSSFFTVRMKRNTAFAFASVAFATLMYKILGHLILMGWTALFAHQGYGLSFKQIVLGSVLPQLLLNLIVTVPLILLLMFLGPYKKGKNPKISDERSSEDVSWLSI